MSLNPDDAMPLKDIPGLIEESYDSTRITIDRLIKEGIVSKFLGGKDNREKLVKLTHIPPSPNFVLKTTSSTPQSNDIHTFNNTEQNTEQYTKNTEQNQIIQDCSVSSSESEIQSTQPIHQMMNNLEDEHKGKGAHNFSNHNTESLKYDNYEVNTRNDSSETSVPKVSSSLAPTQTNKATHKTIKTDSNKPLDIFPVGAKVKSKHPGYQKDKIGKVIVNEDDVPTPGVARVQWYTPEGYKAEVTTTNTCALKLTDDS